METQKSNPHWCNNRNIYQYFQSQPTPEHVFLQCVLAMAENIDRYTSYTGFFETRSHLFRP